MDKPEEIKRVRSLSVDEFRSNYLKNHEPVVITGGIKDWPAFSLWTDEYLKQHAGHFVVGVKAKEDYSEGTSKREDEQEQEVDLATALDYMRRNDAPDLTYARESQILNEVPKLKEDIKTPQYLPNSLSSPLPAHLPSHSDFLGPIAWIGPSNTIAQMHWDCDHNLYAQVRGRKYMMIMEPNVSEYTYPNQFSIADLSEKPHFRDEHPELLEKLKNVVSKLKNQGKKIDKTNFHKALYNDLSSTEVSAFADFLLEINNCHVDAGNPDLQNHPAFAKAKKFQTTLNAGDLLFLPYLWRHYVRSLDPSISVNWFFKPTQFEKNSYDISLKTMVGHLSP